MLFTCIKSWFFRNHLASFHQISHLSFCWNVIDSLFKWSCSIDCQAHIFFFKTKNCSNDDIFISCDDRIWKMLHNICMSAVAMPVRWANRGPWASCLISAQKHRLWYSLEPPRRGGSNYPQSMFWAETWKISEFFIWKFSVFGGEFSIYWNRRVFVMKVNFTQQSTEASCTRH